MRIILFDLVQLSNAPDAIKSPSLAERWMGDNLVITLDQSRRFDAIGIGNTDATTVTIDQSPEFTFDENGLYLIGEHETDSISITTNGTHIGRIAIGIAHHIPISPSREPRYEDPQIRETLSGQVILSAGGISRRKIDIDVRYKITNSMLSDIHAAGESRVYPYFILFDSPLIPWRRIYARDESGGSYQSSVNRLLFSRRFRFKECF